jgi:hypothetical protein
MTRPNIAATATATSGSSRPYSSCWLSCLASGTAARGSPRLIDSDRQMLAQMREFLHAVVVGVDIELEADGECPSCLNSSLLRRIPPCPPCSMTKHQQVIAYPSPTSPSRTSPRDDNRSTKNRMCCSRSPPESERGLPSVELECFAVLLACSDPGYHPAILVGEHSKVRGTRFASGRPGRARQHHSSRRGFLMPRCAAGSMSWCPAAHRPARQRS